MTQDTQTLWHGVMYCAGDEDWALEVVSPSSYERVRRFAVALAEATGHEVVVERVVEI